MRKYSKKDNKYYNLFVYFPQCSNKNLGEICLTKQIVAFMKNFSLCFFFSLYEGKTILLLLD